MVLENKGGVRWKRRSGSEVQEFVLFGLGDQRPGLPFLLLGNLHLQGLDSVSSQIPVHSAKEGFGGSPALCQMLLGYSSNTCRSLLEKREHRDHKLGPVHKSFEA